MQDEYLDIVNDDDQVIGKALYQDVYKNVSSHRIVHVLVFNPKGEILLQLRAKNRSFAPSHWSTSVGGHVRSGESYEEAALRETKEELGITPKITREYKTTYIDTKNHKKFLTIFKTIDDGHTFSIDPEEVERVEYKSFEDIQTMYDNGAKFHPELLFILHKYYNLSI